MKEYIGITGLLDIEEIDSESYCPKCKTKIQTSDGSFTFLAALHNDEFCKQEEKKLNDL